MTRDEFRILKAKVMARRALLAEMAASPMGYTLNQEQMGVVLIMGGVSLRTNGAPRSAAFLSAARKFSLPKRLSVIAQG